MKTQILSLILVSLSSFFHSQRFFAQDKPKCSHFQKSIGTSDVFISDPGNLRSDTIDIQKYSIYLDLTLMNNQILRGECTIDLKSKMNQVSEINLDLLQLQVDSVKIGNTHLEYTHNNDVVHITFGEVLSLNDDRQVSIYYHGQPATDNSFGGFYFQSGYAYNLGVAFNDNPHNYGRAWFPCFDNFVERSTYDIQVLTNSNRTAYCGGIRTSVEYVGQDSILTSWSLTQEIPTYLASVAVTNYTHVEKNYESISGENIPIWLIARSSDTSAMKQSFVNLVTCTEGFENKLGPYRWNKIGFVKVPFGGGAMEHTTNIAYPAFAVNGSLSYETLYAHELSHHWFGNLVTCRNAEDMWLNEGWASYCESLFLENKYGIEAYNNAIRRTHKDALLYAHRNDGGRFPVSGVPTEMTYGSHVYTKGADIAHTLRGYMGEEAFFTAIKAYMEEYQFRDVTSEDMRDFFQQYTDANLTNFFDDWVFQPGYPEFRIRKYQQIDINTWEVVINQNKHYNPEFYNNVPMRLTVMDSELNRQFFDVFLTGEETSVVVSIPETTMPIAFFLNEEHAISQAVLAENKFIKTSYLNDFPYAEADIHVSDFGGMDSIFVRIENHFAAADPLQSQAEYYISPDRWWEVFHNGNLQSVLNCRLRYYGNSSQNKFFDPLFFEYLQSNSLSENDMIMLYRQNGEDPWQEVTNYYQPTIGSMYDWTGEVSISNIQPGQYAWAVRTEGTKILETPTPMVNIFYNHSKIEVKNHHQRGVISLFDNTGKLLLDQQIIKETTIPIVHLPTGVYHAMWNGENGSKMTIRFIVE